MFRIAPIVLLAASLCSVAAAQTTELAKQPITPEPSANRTVNDRPSADGTVTHEPSAGTGISADLAKQAPSIGQAKPVDKPVPFAGVAYLQLSVDDVGLHAFVHGAEKGFVGVVGLSLTPDLTHSFAGLPPLLTNAVVIAYGFTSTQDLELKAPLFSSPAEAIMVYAQAVILDEQGLWASGIVPLVIGKDGSGKDKTAAQVAADRAAKDRARAAKAAQLALAPAIN